MEVRRVDHVGVIVDDLDEAARLLEAFGLEAGEAIDRDDLRVAFFRCGDVSVEIIEPLEAELRRERLGDGVRARIEHVAFEVGDLGRALAALGALGVRPNAPPLHHAGRSMFWTDPETSDGIMFQFVQHGEGGGRGA
jgi:methylmalonyl-CoA/ethylmalonyl-CoA epimerase